MASRKTGEGRGSLDECDFTTQNPDGRYIITEIECFRDIYTFVNIYAPTQDKEKEQFILLETLLEDIVKFEGKNLIYGGDFNIIFDPKLDKKRRKHTFC